MTKDTNDTAHSPTPWNIGEYNESNGDLYIQSHGCTIASANSYCFSTDKYNAEYIVKCVNSHDDIISALMRCRTALQLGLLTSKNRNNDELAIKQAERILHKVAAL
jgi:hypothetical protein